MACFYASIAQSPIDKTNVLVFCRKFCYNTHYCYAKKAYGNIMTLILWNYRSIIRFFIGKKSSTFITLMNFCKNALLPNQNLL